LYVYNKADGISLEHVDALARQPNTAVISCSLSLGLGLGLSKYDPASSGLIPRIWASLGLVRVYTKKRGAPPDLSDPVCLRAGSTVQDVCDGIHRSLAARFRYAVVWGRSSRFAPHAQKVSLAHKVQDEDVVSSEYRLFLGCLDAWMGGI
jgi:ribosome-interacting GTPase 1